MNVVSPKSLALAVAALASVLTGCTNFDRLAQVGEAPPMTRIQNPTARPGYRAVSMPMPAPAPVHREANSLWRRGSRAFFKDQRAAQVGDILTVVIDINDAAKINNKTTRTRDNTEHAGAKAILGYEAGLNRPFPQEIDPENLIDLNSKTKSEGEGKIERDEDIDIKVAAVVAQVLPNGNLVIHGRQEVRVNFEVRELSVIGVVRREDINSDNTVRHDQIAEARIIYGGRGTLSDVQQPRYGQEIFDIIYPF